MAAAVIAGVGLAGAIMGCTTPAPKAEAQAVQLVFTESRVQDCSFRGDVVGSEGRWFDSWAIPNDTLTRGALNDLRNQAHAVGADTVLIPALTNLFRTSVTIFGQAFRCK